MKRICILLTLLILVAHATGCGCVRRLRDRVGRGAYCGPPAAATAAPVAAPAAIPQPVLAGPPAVAPPPMPVQAPMAAPQPLMMAPQPAMPMCVPCDPCCIPCDPCCDPCQDPCGYGYGYGGYYGYGGMTPTATGCYDSGWATDCDGCATGGGTESQQPQQQDNSKEVDPAPVGGDQSL